MNEKPHHPDWNLRKSISPDTKIFGIIGHPVSHSMSPAMHNAAMAATGFDGVYLAFDVLEPIEALKAAKTLHVQGFSVTIPHKVSILAGLDYIDPLAKAIGACNTVVYNERGWCGYNSDGWGALSALKEKINEKKSQNPNKSIVPPQNALVLGNGGAARAIVFFLKKEYPEMKISLAVRDQKNGQMLLNHLRQIFPDEYGLLDYNYLIKTTQSDYDLIINTTPIGMSATKDQTPFPEHLIHSGQIIFDTIYNPRPTRLLSLAQEKKTTTLDGTAMLLYQGVFQFELFTGRNAPIDIMRQALEEKLSYL